MPSTCTARERRRGWQAMRARRVFTDDDVNAIADAVVDELEARGLLSQPAPAAILTAAQVATMLGRSRDWVYEHADELGAFRAGRRLGFQRSAIDRWIHENTIAKRPLSPAPARRGPARRAPLPARVELIPFEEGR